MSQNHQKNNRVFISFSHRDEPAFFALFTSLRKQGYDPFTYQIYGKEIPPGASIQERLREEIAGAAWFIPLISANSLASMWVAYESHCAAQLGQDRLRVTPLVDHHLRGQSLHFLCDHYPDANCLLEPIALHWGDFDDVESLVRSLFHKSGLPYTPLEWGGTDTGLFFQRAYEEIPRLSFRDPDHSLGQLGQAMELLDKCERAYSRSLYSRALGLANMNDRFLVEHTTDSKGSYNLGLIRVSLLMRFAQTGSAIKIKRIRAILRRLTAHGRKDEVVYQGLGYLALGEEKWLQARALYEIAYSINPREPDAIHGLALATLRANLTLSRSLLDELRNITSLDPECLAVLMLAYACSKDWESMRRLLQKISSDGNTGNFLSTVLIAAFAAGNDWNADFAESLLQNAVESCRGEKNEEILLAGVGALSFRRSQLAAARDCFQRLVALAPHNVNHLGRYMQVLCYCGDRQNVEALAIKILELGPARQQDYDGFYYRGMAKWVLGFRDAAELDFAQSQAQASQQYSQVLPIQTNHVSSRRAATDGLTKSSGIDGMT